MHHSTCPRSLDHTTPFTLFGSQYPSNVLWINSPVHALWITLHPVHALWASLHPVRTLWLTLPCRRSLDHSTCPRSLDHNPCPHSFAHTTLSMLFGSRYPVHALWITLLFPRSLGHTTRSTLFGTQHLFTFFGSQPLSGATGHMLLVPGVVRFLDHSHSPLSTARSYKPVGSQFRFNSKQHVLWDHSPSLVPVESRALWITHSL